VVTTGHRLKHLPMDKAEFKLPSESINRPFTAIRKLTMPLHRRKQFFEKFFEKPSEKKAREKNEAIRRLRKPARKRAQREGLLPASP
jgi:small subunit ribosomal protein S21